MRLIPWWGLLAIYLVFGGFCVVFVRGLWLGVPVYWNAKASAGWPAAVGTIVSSTVEREVTNNQRSVSYSAEVRYRFEVGGREWTGDRVRLGVEGDSSSEQAQREVAGRFVAGAAVRVFYDPGNPASNVLLAGPGEQSFVGMWLTVVLLGLSLVPVVAATVVYFFVGE